MVLPELARLMRLVLTFNEGRVSCVYVIVWQHDKYAKLQTCKTNVQTRDAAQQKTLQLCLGYVNIADM